MTNYKLFNKKITRKLLLYELNEVPIKVFRKYIELKPNSCFAQVFKEGLTFKTKSSDIGELHPWSTWPTVHRGVSNKLHNINFINQDLKVASEYKPIWDILSLNNFKVGVFGSLQSYPPSTNKNICFYLPDTFSPDNDAYPAELSKFQDFNLKLVNDNKAISRDIKKGYFLDALRLFLANMISLKTAKSTIVQIIKEKINSKHKSRRSILQGTYTFDLYLKYLKLNKPDFSTYFTNHVAGTMHRYWKYLFPEDFLLNKENLDSFHENTIIKAMDESDKHLKSLIDLVNNENYNLMIVTSMGQKAVTWDPYIPELVLVNFNNLIEVLNLDQGSFKLLPAMQPDICIDCSSQAHMDQLRSSIKFLQDLNGTPVLIERYEPKGSRINLSIQKLFSVSETQNIYFKDKSYKATELGFEIISRDIGTGYHDPEGVFVAYGDFQDDLKKHLNKVIDTRCFCPLVLDFFNLDLPKYMKHTFW